MYLHDVLGQMERRQETPSPPTQPAQPTQPMQPMQPTSTPGFSGDNGGGIPTYVWITVVIFIAISVTCGICARRNYRRQMLYRERVLNSGLNRPPPFLPFSRVYRPGDSAGDLRPPPRARRRPSQASITSLPLYMENPGAQEVVLLQRTGPKEDEHTSLPPPASPSQATQPQPQPLTSTTSAPTYTRSTSLDADHQRTRSTDVESERTLTSSPPPGLHHATTEPVSSSAPVAPLPTVTEAHGPESATAAPAATRTTDSPPPPVFPSTNPFAAPMTDR